MEKSWNCIFEFLWEPCLSSSSLGSVSEDFMLPVLKTVGILILVCVHLDATT